jgi:hypothetical protein
MSTSSTIPAVADRPAAAGDLTCRLVARCIAGARATVRMRPSDWLTFLSAIDPGAEDEQIALDRRAAFTLYLQSARAPAR